MEIEDKDLLSDSQLEEKIKSAQYLLYRAVSFANNGTYLKNAVEKNDLLPNCYSNYFYTNENLKYMPNFTDFADKDVLTVTSSGDHILNSVFLGAKSVDSYDINLLQSFVADIKLTALKRLERDEYVDFIFACRYMFKQKTYNKIRDFLNPNTRAFFDGIYAYLKGIPEDMRKYSHNGFIVENIGEPEIFIKSNPYLLSKSAYKETKSRLKKLSRPVTYRYCPAHLLDKIFKNKDIVILSNILDFYFRNFYDLSDNPNFMILQEPGNPQKFARAIYNVLNDNGVASLYYHFEGNHVDFENLKRIIKPDEHFSKSIIDRKKFTWSNDIEYDTIYSAKKEQLNPAPEPGEE